MSTATPTRPSAARERILDTAFALFYARGIRAVGRRSDHRRVGRGQGDVLQALPRQGRPRRRLPRQGRRGLDGTAAARPRRPPGAAPADQLVGLFDALGTACRREGYRGCAFINAAAESQPGTPVHDRTVAHKAAVLSWVRGSPSRPARGTRRPSPGR